MRWLNFLVCGLAAVAAGSAIYVFTEFGGITHLNLPPIAALPDFRLVDQNGSFFDADTVGSKVAVYNFVFTSCPSSCPLLTQKMRELQERTRGLANLRLVSISVDPKNDTPSVLKAYGAKHGADFSRWTFLTGPQLEIERLVTKGFMSAISPRPGSMMDITHGEHFVVVDARRNIRAFRRVKNDKDLNELERIVVQVARESDPVAALRS